MEITLYHNPKCSKSRKAKELLEEAGCDFHIVEYLKTPPTETELQSLLHKLDCPLHELLRSGEALYKELGLAAANDEQLLGALVKHPELLQRPVVVVNGRAVVARPPERCLELL